MIVGDREVDRMLLPPIPRTFIDTSALTNTNKTSANFTEGGLRNDHEWGLLVHAHKCPAVFHEADSLWQGLSGTIDLAALAIMEGRVIRYRLGHPLPVFGLDEVLRNEGEAFGTRACSLS